MCVSLRTELRGPAPRPSLCSPPRLPLTYERSGTMLSSSQGMIEVELDDVLPVGRSWGFREGGKRRTFILVTEYDVTTAAVDACCRDTTHCSFTRRCWSVLFPIVQVGYMESIVVHCCSLHFGYLLEDVFSGSSPSSSCPVGLLHGGIFGLKDLTMVSGQFLMSALSQHVSIAVEAETGVHAAPCCILLDGADFAVGYGTDSGTDYWKVQFSCGTALGASRVAALAVVKSEC